MAKTKEHARVLDTATLPTRFWSRVIAGPVDCWCWIGRRDKDGYGRYTIRGIDNQAHRVAYSALREPIPEGLTVDHLCRRKECVNPAHMEVVTQEENYRRAVDSRTHCFNGHEHSPANTRLEPGTSRRICRACDRERARRYKAARSKKGKTP